MKQGIKKDIFVTGMLGVSVQKSFSYKAGAKASNLIVRCLFT